VDEYNVPNKVKRSSGVACNNAPRYVTQPSLKVAPTTTVLWQHKFSLGSCIFTVFNEVVLVVLLSTVGYLSSC